MWRMKFGEYDGYDCMTAGYTITENNEVMCVIDCGDYDTKEKAESIAKLIVEAVNEFKKKGGGK